MGTPSLREQCIKQLPSWIDVSCIFRRFHIHNGIGISEFTQSFTILDNWRAYLALCCLPSFARSKCKREFLSRISPPWLYRPLAAAHIAQCRNTFRPPVRSFVLCRYSFRSFSARDLSETFRQICDTVQRRDDLARFQDFVLISVTHGLKSVISAPMDIFCQSVGPEPASCLSLDSLYVDFGIECLPDTNLSVLGAWYLPTRTSVFHFLSFLSVAPIPRSYLATYMFANCAHWASVSLTVFRLVPPRFGLWLLVWAVSLRSAHTRSSKNRFTSVQSIAGIIQKISDHLHSFSTENKTSW